MQVNSARSDEDLAELWAQAGIRVTPLSRYYQGEQPQHRDPCLLINYSGLDEGQLYRLNQLPKI